MGRWRTKSLFIEFAHPDYPAIFTLADEDKTLDGTTYISAKRKYLEYQDPFEHTFAQSVFGSYECWQAVSSSPDLAPSIEDWRVELDAHLRSLAFAKLKERALDGDVSAIKHLLALGGKKGKSTKEQLRPVGRPSKTLGSGTVAKIPYSSGASISVDHSESLSRMKSDDSLKRMAS